MRMMGKTASENRNGVFLTRIMLPAWFLYNRQDRSKWYRSDHDRPSSRITSNSMCAKDSISIRSVPSHFGPSLNTACDEECR